MAAPTHAALGGARSRSPGPGAGEFTYDRYSPGLRYITEGFLDYKKRYFDLVFTSSQQIINVFFSSLMQRSFGPSQMAYIVLHMIFFLLQECGVKLPEEFWQNLALILGIFPGNHLALLRGSLWMITKILEVVQLKDKRKEVSGKYNNFHYKFDLNNFQKKIHFFQHTYRNLTRENKYLKFGVKRACFLLFFLHLCNWFIAFVQLKYSDYEMQLYGNWSNANPLPSHIFPADFLDMGGANPIPDLEWCTNAEELRDQHEFNKILYSTVNTYAMRVYLIFTKQTPDILDFILKVLLVCFCMFCGIYSVLGSMMFGIRFEVQKRFRHVLSFILLLYVVFIVFSLLKQEPKRYLHVEEHVQHDEYFFSPESKKVFISQCGGNATEVYDASKLERWKSAYEYSKKYSEPCRTVYGCKQNRFYDQCIWNKDPLFEYPMLPKHCEKLHSLDGFMWYFYATYSFFFLEHNISHCIVALVVFFGIQQVILNCDKSFTKEICVDGNKPNHATNCWSYCWGSVKPNAKLTLKRVLFVLFVCNAAVEYRSNSCISGKKAVSMHETFSLEEVPTVFSFQFMGMKLDWLSHCFWQVNTWLIHQYNSSMAHMFCVCMVFGAPLEGINGRDNHSRVEWLFLVIAIIHIPVFTVVEFEAILTQNGLGRNQPIMNCGLYVMSAVTICDWYLSLRTIQQDPTLCASKIIMTAIPLKSGVASSQMHEFFDELVITFMSFLMVSMNCCGQLVFAWSLVSLVFLYTTWWLHRCMLDARTKSETSDICQTFIAVQQNKIAHEQHDKSSLIQIIFPLLCSGLIHCMFVCYLHKQTYRNDVDGFFSYISFSKDDAAFYYRTFFHQESYYHLLHDDRSSQATVINSLTVEMKGSMFNHYVYNLVAYIMILLICVYCLSKFNFGLMVQCSRNVAVCRVYSNNETSTAKCESTMLQLHYTCDELVKGVPNVLVIMDRSEYLTPIGT